MNRCRIYRSFLDKVKTGLKTGKGNRQVRDFMAKWKLVLKGRDVFHDGRQVIPYEDTEAILKKEAIHGGMPLSRDGAFHYLKKKYVGFKKKKILEWLKRVESLQLIHRRSEVPTSRSQNPREGSTNWRMASANEGAYNLGVDLFDIPIQWSKYKFFFIAVLQKSGYTWIIPMVNKKAKTALGCLKQVFPDCKRLFGSEPTAVTSDKGGEFYGEFEAWLKRKNVKQRFERKLCSWVEKKNSTVFRTFAVLRKIHGFHKARDLTLEKVNNIRSRITRKTPAEWTKDDFQKGRVRRHNKKIPYRPKRRKPVVLEVGDRVRHMLKQAIDKGGFYKSYEGMRKKSHWMWSRTIFTVTARRKMSGDYGYKYKLNDPDQYWWFSRELQKIEGDVVRLLIPKPKPAKRAPKPKKKPAPLRRSARLAQKAPSQARKKPAPAPVLRRSSRARKAPVRYGFS